jgi:hypothetical protein
VARPGQHCITLEGTAQPRLYQIIQDGLPARVITTGDSIGNAELQPKAWIHALADIQPQTEELCEGCQACERAGEIAAMAWPVDRGKIVHQRRCGHVQQMDAYPGCCVPAQDAYPQQVLGGLRLRQTDAEHMRQPSGDHGIAEER